MKNMVSYCGFDCSKCDAYIATISNQDEVKRKIAERWRDLYNPNIKDEDIKCLGCKSGLVYCRFKDCEIRKCNEEKSIKACGYCNEYPCVKIEAFFKSVPQNKIFMDKLNQEYLRELK